MTFSREQLRQWLLASIITFAGYLLVAQVSGYIYRNVGTSPVAVMTPAGIALAALLIEGYAMLPAIMLAAFANGFLSSAQPLLLAGSVLGNTLQPLLITYVLSKFDFERGLASVKDVFLMLGAAIFGTMIVPTMTVASVYLYNAVYMKALVTHWLTWWLAAAISVLAVTTFLIRWIRTPVKKKKSSEIFEMITAIGAMCIVTFFIFWTPYSSFYGFSLIYPQLALLLWISLRARPRFMTLAILIETMISITGALLGTHLPASGDVPKVLYGTEVYDLIFMTIFFIIFSLEDQRKRVTEALKERTDTLESALTRIRDEEQAKNEFIATLAHELRNPLAALLTSVELLDIRGSQEKEAIGIRGTMFHKIRSMSRLLDDLLDIARITKKQLLLCKENTELNVVIQHAVENCMHHVKERRQSLSVSMPVEAVLLSADPVRLEQAFTNLITNASKYTPQGGDIEVTGRYRAGWASVTISDTGIGIPADMLTRIFEPFVQIKPPGKNSDGLGIGLSLSKSLIEMHGGSVIAKMRQGARGSEFTVLLPTIGSGKVRAEIKPVIRTSASPIPNAFKILVVDDNVEAAQSLGKLLSFRGHDVSVAHDGKEAISRIPKEDPEVVLLDIGLPDMDGYEVAQKLRRMESVPVLIALTGYGQENDLARAREAGFDYHLTKPAGLAEIENVLKDIRVAA